MKPADIPQGVWDAARKADDECDRHPDWGWKPTEIIARAIMAEREACAQLILDHGHSNGNIRPVHKHLANAIRSRP